jgi:hypothetical protein
MEEKALKPPYTSFKGFINFIDELRSHGEAPSVIDRSLLSKRSGSDQSALMATLRWFSLITDTGSPTDLFKALFDAHETDRQDLLNSMVADSYAFLSDSSFNVRNATTAQLTERFREYGITGSTLNKSISFFIAICKEAEIQISSHIKIPSISGASTRQMKKKIPRPAETWPMPPTQTSVVDATQLSYKNSSLAVEMIEIPVPIFGMQDGTIRLPAKLDDKQWASVVKMTEFILKNYRDMTTGSDSNTPEKEVSK